MDVVRTVFDALGAEVDIQFWPWQVSLQVATEGLVAGTFPHTKKEQDTAPFFYSQPLYRVPTRAFARRPHPGELPPLEDLDNVLVCQPQTHATALIQALGAQGRLVLQSPADAADCFRMLAQGEVGLVAMDELSGQHLLSQLELTDTICMIENALAIDTLHVLFSKFAPKSRALVDGFDQALARLEANNVLQEITARHLKVYYDVLPTLPTLCGNRVPHGDPHATHARYGIVIRASIAGIPSRTVITPPARCATNATSGSRSHSSHGTCKAGQ